MNLGLRGASLGAAAALLATAAQALPLDLQQCLAGVRSDEQAAQCWTAARERQEGRVADLHRRLLQYLPPNARAEFDDVQSAWLRFRDASCAWERRALLCCDMTEQLAENTCRVERSEARAADLERLVASFGPGGPLSSAAVAPAREPARASARADGMIIADSSERRLAPADVAGLDRQQLRLARNEIYARHGRIFEARDLQDYFARQPWYRPQSRQVVLTPIERANVTLLESLERQR